MEEHLFRELFRRIADQCELAPEKAEELLLRILKILSNSKERDSSS